MNLLRRLSELQEEHGYLAEETLRELARADNVPLHRLHELVSFYPHFRTSPPPILDVAVCRDVSCWLNGASDACRRLREQHTSSSDTVVREVSCLGRCDGAPAIAVNHAPHEAPTPPQSWRCDPYATPGERYGLLGELLRDGRDAAAARVLAALKESGLRGMGGAAFPTAIKWELVRAQNSDPKYVICNADESEPGTFKDRALLDGAPHLVLEGMLLAGLVTGADSGILFIRHEYEPERRRFARALDEARQSGLVGANVAGSGFTFDVEIFVSPGGYILGEETALLECLEDRRGEPRNKPPFPGTHGLFGRPTVINNVETLALIPGIVRRGPAWWKAQGKPGFAGLKLIALSGHVERPGVYEVPVGTTVRELIDLGGGVSGGRALKAFAPGGASSNWMPAALADTPLDFQALAKAGSMLGSGAVIVVAEGTDMLALAANGVRFFRNESCGKCVPCRLGSQKAVELLEQVCAGKAPRTELQVLPDLGETMAQTSICGLGQVALNPVLSVMKHWPEEVTK